MNKMKNGGLLFEPHFHGRIMQQTCPMVQRALNGTKSTRCDRGREVTFKNFKYTPVK